LQAHNLSLQKSPSRTEIGAQSGMSDFSKNRHFISHSLRENSPYRLDLDRLRPSSSRSPWPATGKPPPAAALVAADALGFRLLFLRIACYPACGRSWLFNGCFAGAGKGAQGHCGGCAGERSSDQP
jgi:hypothetical protein